jgi:hypothetical protein
VNAYLPVAPASGRISRLPRTGAQAAPAVDQVELSADAVNLHQGATAAAEPATYGPRGLLRHDGAGRQASVSADTTVSKKLTQLMTEIEAVQQHNIELIGRYRRASA